MNKSSYSTSILRSIGETLIRCGDSELGTALLELADYRDAKMTLMARSRFDRHMIAYADSDILETKIKSELSKMISDKLIEERIVNFSQSFDDRTNELIFQGEVNVLKGM